jgi:zinc/manganese transport system permease protein
MMAALEFLWPPFLVAFCHATEAATYEDARRYAARYRAEAERLNEVETRSRSQGEVLADDLVAKMSSFVRSYGEMRRGEEFVMREVRSRARERLRWIAGPLLFVLALLVAPGVRGRGGRY